MEYTFRITKITDNSGQTKYIALIKTGEIWNSINYIANPYSGDVVPVQYDSERAAINACKQYKKVQDSMKFVKEFIL